MADFFIRRPIVAIVIAILIVMLGAFSLRNLSIEAYRAEKEAHGQ